MNGTTKFTINTCFALLPVSVYESASLMVCCTNSACIHLTLCKKISKREEQRHRIYVHHWYCSLYEGKGQKRKQIHKRKGKRLNSMHNHSTLTHAQREKESEWERVSSIFGLIQSDAKHCETQSIKWAHQKEQRAIPKSIHTNMRCIYNVLQRAKENALYYIINVCGSLIFTVCTTSTARREENCMRNAGSLNRSFPTVEWNTSIGQQHQSISSFRFCLFYFVFLFHPLFLYHVVFKFFFFIFLWTCVGTICCCIPELKLRFNLRCVCDLFSY